MTVSGADRVQRQLYDLARRGSDQTATMTTQAQAMQRQISGVPVRSGRLARSVAGGAESVLHADASGYQIGSAVPYAGFVFGGTRHQAAQPPRVPASAAEQAAEAVSRDLDQAR